jgi:hypothetical protein
MSVRVVWVERLLAVEFGPSRSKRFAKAVAAARSGPGECSELEPGRYRTRFVLGEDAALGENPRPGNIVEITLGPKLRALLAGELSPDLDQDSEVPDFVPQEWGEPAAEQPPG